MMDRAQLIAMLPDGAAKVLGVIERVAGDRAVARVSFLDFQFEHRLGRLTISRAIGLLQDTGLIDVEKLDATGRSFYAERRQQLLPDLARTGAAMRRGDGVIRGCEGEVRTVNLETAPLEIEQPP